MKVGDKVRLKQGLIDGNTYGDVDFLSHLALFNGCKNIEAITGGFIYLNEKKCITYTPEMLELVEDEKHDSHYAKQRDAGNETIVELELFAEQLKPKIIDGSLSMAQLVNLILAKKNFSRAGTKDDPLMEIRKTKNYLHRAETGEWL